MHASVPIAQWNPDLPAGTLRSIRLHWTAGDYATIFPAYHFCISGADAPVVHATHDLRDNMRDVRADPDLPYAAHTRGRNSFSVGIAVCSMRGARPDCFGQFPITGAQIAALCRVSEHLAWTYGIPIGAIGTHAEAAVDDGYFGADEDQRWDIARVAPEPRALTVVDAAATGDFLRAEILQLRAVRLAFTAQWRS